MSFLPLVGGPGEAEDGLMHPYAVDRMVQERRQEVVRLRGGPRRVDAVRPDRQRAWRRAAARALVAAAIAVGVPRSRRPAAQHLVTTAFGFEPPC
jgi:hypothetical protein